MGWLKKLFGMEGYRNYVCFRVENYKEVNRCDNAAMLKLERNLLKAGAIPGSGSDSPPRICATITDPTITPKDIQKVMEKLGFRAKLIRTEEKT